MLDLNEHLIQHPAATFYLRVSGSSMIGAGINDGDLLIVDRSLAAAHNHIVVAIVNSEFTVKRLYSKNGKHALLAENPEHPPIHLTDSDSVEVWGVVLHVIHSLV